jgi:hypothetical protein
MSHVADLLQQIANNTAKDSSLWVAIVAGGAAILGAVVTAIFSYCVAARTAKSQRAIESDRLHASIVTAERLRWLQDIRQRFSELYAELDMQYNRLKRPVPADQAAAFQRTMDKFSAKITEQSNVITLMLNPGKADQAALGNSLQGTLAFLTACFSEKNQGRVDFDDAQYALLKQTAFDSLTRIGIATWARIQRLQ